jgi:hypothetical protein
VRERWEDGQVRPEVLYHGSVVSGGIHHDNDQGQDEWTSGGVRIWRGFLRNAGRSADWPQRLHHGPIGRSRLPINCIIRLSVQCVLDRNNQKS